MPARGARKSSAAKGDRCQARKRRRERRSRGLAGGKARGKGGQQDRAQDPPLPRQPPRLREPPRPRSRPRGRPPPSAPVRRPPATEARGSQDRARARPRVSASRLDRRRFAALDGLRGFAVLLVFCVHAAGNASAVVLGADFERARFATLTTFGDRLLFWLYASHHGVFLFFVLSGFLIGRMWWPRPAMDYATFARRRTLRIYPAFLLAFAGSLAFAYASGTWQPPDMPRLVANVLFLNGAPGLDVTAFNIVTWSLFYEMTFYLAFPALALLAARERGARRAVAVGRGDRPAGGRRATRRQPAGDVLVAAVLRRRVRDARSARARAGRADAHRGRRARLPGGARARAGRCADRRCRPSCASALPRSSSSRRAWSEATPCRGC